MADGLQHHCRLFLTKTVGGAFKGFEARTSQLQVLDACARAIDEGGTLLAESGTGTGKTFAYLVPILLSGKKAIVSTRTKNLQEQLSAKDLRFLAALRPFEYAIAKGRVNYLCLRRLNAFRASDEREADEYRHLALWASDTDTGDIEDYGLRIPALWDKACCDADACTGLQCRYYHDCFYFGARRRWETAQIVVANHALLGINSMLSHDAVLLPGAEVLVIDEAHSLDHALSDVVGLTVSNTGVERLFNRLLRLDDRSKYRGLLSESPHLFSIVEALRTEVGIFWTKIGAEFANRETVKGVFRLAHVATNLAESLQSLIEDVRASATGLFEEDAEIELKAALAKFTGIAMSLEEYVEGSIGHVRWVEREDRRTALRMCPIYPREVVVNRLLPAHHSVILTSATLSLSGNFSFIRGVLGLEDAAALSVASPFDLARAVDFQIAKGIDLARSDGVSLLVSVILEEAARGDGGLLVLFTSRDIMQRTWDAAAAALRDLGRNAMVQGDLSNRLMLENMRDSQDSVIFGLDSFWEGIDVRGDALKSLIITKLPFEVPTEPITMARAEEIQKRGGNPFYEYSLPRAVLKFKQGFGRLIRSKTDTGRVIVCDERILTRRYGRHFMDVLGVASEGGGQWVHKKTFSAH